MTSQYSATELVLGNRQGFRGGGVQGCRGAGVLGCRGAEVQGCRGYRGAGEKTSPKPEIQDLAIFLSF